MKEEMYTVPGMEGANQDGGIDIFQSVSKEQSETMTELMEKSDIDNNVAFKISQKTMKSQDNSGDKPYLILMITGETKEFEIKYSRKDTYDFIKTVAEDIDLEKSFVLTDLSSGINPRALFSNANNNNWIDVIEENVTKMVKAISIEGAMENSNIIKFMRYMKAKYYPEDTEFDIDDFLPDDYDETIESEEN